MADVGSINYNSEKTEFLDDKTIKSIIDSIKSGITNITESLVTVIDDESGNGLSEESFNVDGEGIIYNKSQEIKKDIESFTDKVRGEIILYLKDVFCERTLSTASLMVLARLNTGITTDASTAKSCSSKSTS